nr:ribonuclease domain-containing protein [Corynebacterium lactis]
MAEWKKLGGGIAAAVLVLAGSYFGLDLGGNDGSGAGDNPNSSSSTTSKSSPQPSAKPSQKSSHKPAPGGNGATCSVNTLPKEADQVINRILTDQDHIYAAHDGKHFGNYEGVLPKKDSSYYREYTVTTPGKSNRGARRIVVGGGTETDPDVWYYTDDHYESFCVIPDAEN